MSNSSNLPQTSGNTPPLTFSVTILVKLHPNGKIVGRSANLVLPVAEADTIRHVLASMTKQAKELLADHTARGVEIPWIDPADKPATDEKQFLIPLHL